MSCKLTESEHNKFISSLYWLVFRLSEDENCILDLPSNLTMPCESASNSTFIIKSDVVEYMCSGFPYYCLCVILQTKLDPLAHFSIERNLSHEECFKKVSTFIVDLEKNDTVNFFNPSSTSVDVLQLTKNGGFNFKAHIKLLDTIMLAFSKFYVNISQVVIEAKRLTSFRLLNCFDGNMDLENAFVFWFNSLYTNMGINLERLQHQDERKMVDLISNGVTLCLVLIKYFPDLATNAFLSTSNLNSWIENIDNLDRQKINEKRKQLLSKVRKIFGESKKLLTVLCLSVGDMMFPVESLKPNFIVVLSELFHCIIKASPAADKDLSHVTLDQMSEDFDVFATSDDASIEEMIKNMQTNNAVDLSEEEKLPLLYNMNISGLANATSDSSFPNASVHPNKASYAHDRLQTIYSRIASIKQKNSMISKPNTTFLNVNTFSNSTDINLRDNAMKPHVRLSPIHSVGSSDKALIEISSQHGERYSNSFSKSNSSLLLNLEEIPIVTHLQPSPVRKSVSSPNNFHEAHAAYSPTDLVNFPLKQTPHNASIYNFETNLNKSCEVPSIYRHEDSLTTDDEEEYCVDINKTVDPRDTFMWFDQSKIAELEESINVNTAKRTHSHTTVINDEPKSMNETTIFDYFNSTDDEVRTTENDDFSPANNHSKIHGGLEYENHPLNVDFSGSRMAPSHHLTRLISSTSVSSCSSLESVISNPPITSGSSPTSPLNHQNIYPVSLSIPVDTNLSPAANVANSPLVDAPQLRSCKIDLFEPNDPSFEMLEQKKQQFLAWMQQRNRPTYTQSIKSNVPTKLNTTVQRRIEKNKPLLQVTPTNRNHQNNSNFSFSTLKKKSKVITTSDSSRLNTSKIPKLYAPIKLNSNRSLIHNALTNYCLAGDTNKKIREKAIEQLSLCNGTHFLVHLKPTFQYRGLYVYYPEQDDIATRIHGVGPRHIESNNVEAVYRYHSDKKQFTIIPFSKTISISSDGFTIATIKKQGSSTPSCKIYQQ